MPYGLNKQTHPLGELLQTYKNSRQLKSEAHDIESRHTHESYSNHVPNIILD